MKELLIIFIVVPCMAFAQYTEQEVIKFLTNDNSKLWYFDQYTVHMGGSDSCKKGESYTFTSNKKVKIKKCVNGIWQKTEYDWTLQEDSPVDWWITIAAKKYYLVLTKKSGHDVIKLRNSTPGKADPTFDIELKNLADE